MNYRDYINFAFGDTFGNFSGFFNQEDVFDYTFEQYVGTALVGKSQYRFTAKQAQIWFYQAIAKLKGQSPQGIKIIRYDYIWDQIEQKEKAIENSAEAWNFHRDDWDLA